MNQHRVSVEYFSLIYFLERDADIYRCEYKDIQHNRLHDIHRYCVFEA